MTNTRLHHVIAQLGVRLDPELLSLALTHRSYAYENGNLPTNERLEFLGDSVLGIIVTDRLYRDYPDFDEGRLAKLRANVVSSKSLSQVARSLNVGQMIKLGHGEVTTGGANKTSILADTMEAIIGAVHLSGGLGDAKKFVLHLFHPLILDAVQLGPGLDWKTSLQEVAAAQGLGQVTYEVTGSGPDHLKEFQAWALVGDQRIGPGVGPSKKKAEASAASLAYGVIRPSEDDA